MDTKTSLEQGPERVTAAIMAKANGGQQQILDGHVSDVQAMLTNAEAKLRAGVR